MNKILLYSIFTFSIFAFSSLKAQSKNEIETWVINNPNVILIEKSNFESFTTQEIEKLKGNYIVFESEITLEDVENFEAKSNLQINNNQIQESKTSDEQEIKNWLAKHPHLKIVKQSEYLTEASDIQREYIANRCLVLIGEEVSIYDIKNYKF